MNGLSHLIYYSLSSSTNAQLKGAENSSSACSRVLHLQYWKTNEILICMKPGCQILKQCLISKQAFLLYFENLQILPIVPTPLPLYFTS